MGQPSFIAIVAVLAVLINTPPSRAADILTNSTLILSSPISMVLSTGTSMSGSGQMRFFFARDGNRFISTYNGGGVVLAPGATSGSFSTPDGTQFTAQVSGSSARLMVDVHAREPIEAVPGASFNMRSWYVLSVASRSCTILQGDTGAWIEGNVPLTLSVNKGAQTCSVQPGRHLF